MGGMCLGSLLLSRLVSQRRHPLRVYALLELGIAASGVAILLGGSVGLATLHRPCRRGLPGMLLRGLLAALCLLPPTVLMGATLPAMARWIETTPRRSFLARIFLRREHCRSRPGLSARGILSVASA